MLIGSNSKLKNIDFNSTLKAVAQIKVIYRYSFVHCRYKNWYSSMLQINAT